MMRRNVAAALSVFGLLVVASCSIQSDAELQATFDAHSQRFVEARDFMRVNKIETIGLGSTGDMPTAVVEQLKSRLGEVQCKRITVKGDGDVLFILDAVGMAGGAYRGVLWTEHPDDKRLVSALREGRRHELVIKPLGQPGWYMYSF